MDIEQTLTHQVHVRLSEATYRRLRAVARAEHRTLGAQARLYIERGLEEAAPVILSLSTDLESVV